MRTYSLDSETNRRAMLRYYINYDAKDHYAYPGAERAMWAEYDDDTVVWGILSNAGGLWWPLTELTTVELARQRIIRHRFTVECVDRLRSWIKVSIGTRKAVPTHARITTILPTKNTDGHFTMRIGSLCPDTRPGMRLTIGTKFMRRSSSGPVAAIER
jgi:hypothetical protein